MREKLAKLKAKAVDVRNNVAEWVGDYVVMPILYGLGWVFEHPVPFALTIVAGLLIGLIAGG